jgi:transposase
MADASAGQLVAIESHQTRCGTRASRRSSISNRIPSTNASTSVTTNLFAALDFKAGTVIGQFHRRHRGVEFRQFLETIDHQVTHRFALLLIIDNYAIHKTPDIRRWLLRHPRFQLHFTPTGASWLNLVEHWFAGVENNCAEASIAAAANCKTPFATTSNSITVIQNPSSGPKPLTKSQNQLLDFVRTSDSGH